MYPCVAYAPGALATPSAWSVFRALLSVLIGRPWGATLAPLAILKVKYIYVYGIPGAYICVYLNLLYMIG